VNCLNCGKSIFRSNEAGGRKYCNDTCKEEFYAKSSSRQPFVYPQEYSEGFRWYHVWKNSSWKAIEDIEKL